MICTVQCLMNACLLQNYMVYEYCLFIAPTVDKCSCKVREIVNRLCLCDFYYSDLSATLYCFGKTKVLPDSQYFQGYVGFSAVVLDV